MDRPLSKQEIKEICSYVGIRLRDAANANSVLANTMKTFPFTIKNVGVLLLIQNNDGSDIYYLNYCVGQLVIGNFVFRTKDPRKRFGYKTEEVEPFLE